MYCCCCFTCNNYCEFYINLIMNVCEVTDCVVQYQTFKGDSSTYKGKYMINKYLYIYLF